MLEWPPSSCTLSIPIFKERGTDWVDFAQHNRGPLLCRASCHFRRVTFFICNLTTQGCFSWGIYPGPLIGSSTKHSWFHLIYNGMSHSNIVQKDHLSSQRYGEYSWHSHAFRMNIVLTELYFQMNSFMGSCLYLYYTISNVFGDIFRCFEVSEWQNGNIQTSIPKIWVQD